MYELNVWVESVFKWRDVYTKTLRKGEVFVVYFCVHDIVFGVVLNKLSAQIEE